MLKPAYFNIVDPDIKKRVLDFVSQKNTFAFFDSHQGKSIPTPITGNRYAFLAMAGVYDEVKTSVNALHALDAFIIKHQQNLDWICCLVSYDLKNEIEQLDTVGKEQIAFPTIHCFVPEIAFTVDETGLLCVHAASESPESVYNQLMAYHSEDRGIVSGCRVKNKIDKQKYTDAFNQVTQHLMRGDIYEATLCQQAVVSFDDCDPTTLFNLLCDKSPNPFSVLYKDGNKAIACASPERFLRNDFDLLMSQPMKGTSRRSDDQYEDARLKASLASSEKECAENVMIVDLVRNDLSKVAQKGSVKVDELFGVHSFATVHQMITSVSCRLQADIGFASILKATFPMGSMTGAPKISAMKIIDRIEGFKRGMFSGTIGFFAPGGYFDFNVVIRTICLDLENKLATVTAGGAITVHCELESEWQECLLKLKPQLQALGIPIEEAVIQHS
ncbi:MAG: anthranilate synthase component I family protein [Bacteroidota bacterium]